MPVTIDPAPHGVDLNCDCAADLVDYRARCDCLAGPDDHALPEGCSQGQFRGTDLDNDNDADLADFANAFAEP